MNKVVAEVLILLVVCFIGTRDLVAGEVNVWIMAGEALKNENPTPQELKRFKQRYPNASIHISGLSQAESQKVLLANESILKEISRFSDALNRENKNNAAAIEVNVKFFSWHDGPLENIVDNAQQQGADIVQVGSTWIAFLADRKIIKNISRTVKPVEHEYINPVVQSGRYGLNKDYYAIPWSIDIRTWFYNKALLQGNNIDADQISNLSSFNTLCQQYKDKNSWLLGLPTSADDYSTLHIAMSWIWGWGGSIVSEDKRIDLLDDRVVEGMFNYLKLFTNHCAPLPGRDGKSLRLTDVEAQFLQGKFAFVAIGPWILDALPQAQSELIVNHGSIAGRDGASPNVFTGGSFLALVDSERTVIEEKAARHLLRFLSKDADQSVGLPPQKNKLEKMLGDSKTSKYPLILLRREARLFPVIPEWGKIESIVLAKIAKIIDTVGDNHQVNDTELREIIVAEFSQGKKEIEKIVGQQQSATLYVPVFVAILVLLLVLLIRSRQTRHTGKEDLIKRFRRIKEILHTAKLWRGRIDNNNVEQVRQRLLGKMDSISREIVYFKKYRSPQVKELYTYIRDHEQKILDYKNEIARNNDGIEEYENRIIMRFEKHMRPIINEMSNIIENYCVKTAKLTEIMNELKKVFEFEYSINSKTGSLLIRPEDLRICLENLLENAQMVSQHQNPPRTIINVSSDDNLVTIAVSDNGEDFPDEDVKQLMLKGQGLRDILNIIEGWDGSLLIGHKGEGDLKRPVLLIVKRL